MDRRTKQELIERLNRDAEQIAGHFGLHYKSVGAERANVTSRYGVCFEDGTIKIRLRHAVTGKPLKYSSLVNTLCHELAHLRYFHHGERFKVFYQKLLDYARVQQLYQPGPAAAGRTPEPVAVRTSAPVAAEPRAPVQLVLF
jgi:predicted metal-dependent hydrolase